jgi:hypothetical protein
MNNPKIIFPIPSLRTNHTDNQNQSRAPTKPNPPDSVNPRPQTRNRPVSIFSSLQNQGPLTRCSHVPTAEGRTNADIGTTARTNSADLARATITRVTAICEAVTCCRAIYAEASRLARGGADTTTARTTGTKSGASLTCAGVRGTGAVGADAG